MSGDKPDPALHRLLDELADDLMNLSDAELLAELAADGLDVEAEAAAARSAIARARRPKGTTATSVAAR